MERDLALVALFAALIAALGLVPQIALASGVPITAQSLGVMLAGTVLGSKRGGLAVLLFVVLVAMGLPLLSGGRGGLGLFVSPSAGFLIGFPLAAYAAGLVTERWRTASVGVAASAGAALGGIVVLYIPGVAGMSLAAGFTVPEAAVLSAVYLPGDLIKAVLAGLLTASLAKARPASVLSRQPLNG